MANYITTDTELTNIANAIRAKGGTSAQLEYPNDFITAIQAIEANNSEIPSPTTSWEIVFSGTVTTEDMYGDDWPYTEIRPWTEEIPFGSVWRVTFNGVPYICIALVQMDTGGWGYCIGNTVLDGGTNGNNEPFMLQRYWDSSDNCIILLTDDPGTYNITIEKQSTEGWTSIFVGSDGIIGEDTTGYIDCVQPFPNPITLNSAWRITWNNGQYICLPFDFDMDEGQGVVDGYTIGNSIPSGGTIGNGEPFIAQQYIYGTERVLIFGTFTTSGNVNIKVEKWNYDINNNTIVIADEANTTGTTAAITAANITYKHNIYFEFSDSTNTTINVYYDDPLLGTMITAYEPVTYGQKTVTLAQLDGVTWYEPADIPLNTQLIDYTKATQDYVINSQGEMEAEQWYSVSDYTAVESGMTFTYRGSYWFYLAFYDSSKSFISSINIYSDSTQDPEETNIGYGTLSGNKIPSNAKFIRITGGYNLNATNLSLIRTA